MVIFIYQILEGDALKLIVCLDDKNGMLFNNRRQSRDAIVIKDIEEMTADKDLYIREYSKILFQNNHYKLINSISEIPNNNDCYYFNETEKVSDYKNIIDTIIIYRWNRVYPKGTEFDIPLKSYSLLETKDFKGNSHEKITREIYVQ